MVRKYRWRWFSLLGLAGGALLLAGCQSLRYYQQAIGGQYEILAGQRSIERLLADRATPAPLKAKFELVQELRAFAARELALPVDGHYAKYVDLHRRFVVWNVHAAPEFSLEPKTWWYPVVGRLKYRGYFSERFARDYAEQLRTEGYDSYVGAVEAYSTLGWFKDPVLNTFLHHDPVDLAEILFHELAHQQVFARGDTDFNEAFATAVAQEGVTRWLQRSQRNRSLREYLDGIQRRSQFVALVLNTRLALKALYGTNTLPVDAMSPQQIQEFRTLKGRTFAKLQESYAVLKEEWGGNTEYDRWFAKPPNNARLNTVATYNHLVPAFQELLAVNQGNLPKFYRDARRLANQPKLQRHRELLELRNRAMRETRRSSDQALTRN